MTWVIYGVQLCELDAFGSLILRVPGSMVGALLRSSVNQAEISANFRLGLTVGLNFASLGIKNNFLNFP